MITAEYIAEYAKSELAQANDTLIGSLPDGVTQNSYTVASDDQIVRYLNEGADRIAKLCLPIPDTANIASLGAGNQNVGPYRAIISSAGRRLASPSGISVNGNQLGTGEVGYIDGPSAGYWYPPTPTGDPTAWADQKTYALVAPYTSEPTFVFSGYFFPVPAKWVFSDWGLATVSDQNLTCNSGLSAIGGHLPAVGDQVFLSGGGVTAGVYTISSVTSATEVVLSAAPGNSTANVNVTSVLDAAIDEFAARTIAFYVAWMLAQKNMDVNVLMGRIAPCATEFIGGVKEIYTILIETGSTLAAFFPPAPIDSLAQIISQLRPKT